MSDVDSDIGLINFVRTATTKGIENVDYVLSAQRKITIGYRLNSLRRLGKPTSMKELAVGGRDLQKMGLRGKMIGDTLIYLLTHAIETGKNDKNHLLKLAKGRYGKS